MPPTLMSQLSPVLATPYPVAQDAAGGSHTESASNPMTIPRVSTTQGAYEAQTYSYTSGSLSSSLSSSPADNSSHGLVYFHPPPIAPSFYPPGSENSYLGQCAGAVTCSSYPTLPPGITHVPAPQLVTVTALPAVAHVDDDTALSLQHPHHHPPQHSQLYHYPSPVCSEQSAYPPCGDPVYVSSISEMAPHHQQSAAAPLYVQIPPMTSSTSPECSVMPGQATQVSPHHSVTTNMEVVWHGEFDRLFRQLSPHDRWFLVPCLEPPHDHCKLYRDSAKVRFACKCGNGWTSMKGRVMFWFQLDRNANTGFVYFRLYGQKCTKCNGEEFTHALWYPEEVVKVLANVYNRVGQSYYNMVQPQQLQHARRPGKPRNPHNAKLCQACAEGICREEPIVR